MKTRNTQIVLFASIILFCVIGMASLWFWLLIPNNHYATLIRVSIPKFSSSPCLMSSSITNGLMMEFRSEWETTDDIVAVLNTLNQQGFRPSTNFSTSIELLPSHPDILDLWLIQSRVFRGVTLSYTPKHLTRYIDSTAVVFCPP